MAHSLVLQLRFTRSEFARAWKGVSDNGARHRVVPMNCISWIIWHLAWQEQYYFLHYGQGQLPFPQINHNFANGALASTPALPEVVSAWQAITENADPLLDTLTSTELRQHVISQSKPIAHTSGNLVQRVIYHY